MPVSFRSYIVSLVAILFLAGMALPEAFADQRRSATLSQAVATDLLAAFEKIEEEDYRGALTRLNELMRARQDRMTDFDRASVLQIRGSAHVNLENLDEGLNDFAEALRLRALPEDQNERLRYNLAQLYFATERYRESIDFFNRWLEGSDVTPSHTTFFMLAAAHYHLDEFAEALPYIDRAIELTEEPTRRYYDLKNILLSELDRVPARTELMKQMVALWPEELSYWRQLSGLYLDQDMQMESFSTLESAYLGGLIESADDIILLAQFYSTFNNPHRGAKLIEAEMEDGRVERNVRNLELLSQLWSQAREHRRAIPVLREAASISETGDLYFRLGQALLADEQNEAAETAFQNAIDTGGMPDSTMAEIWILLGTARFNQSGPGDRELRRTADQAFAQAERFTATRAQARDWRTYIRAINETETRQAMLEQEQSERMAAAAEERLLQSCRALQIAGRELTAECREVLGDAAEGPPSDGN
jgi:tetratricopeptide (TPR) repeat protein